MCITKVLLVDDDPQIRKITEISLTRIGRWTVMVADSGPQALAMMPEFRPDLVLLDVMMPGMDGMTTFKQLCESEDGNRVPVIFMTAKVQRQEVQSYYDTGAAGVITKPFDPLGLPELIREIIDNGKNKCVSHSC